MEGVRFLRIYLGDDREKHSDLPNFDRSEKEFTVGDIVYVIDENMSDIYEAQVRKIVDDKYSVYYPEYEQDEIVPIDRMLARTETNKEIFDEQEEIRLRKEDGEEDENSGEFQEEEKQEKPCDESKDDLEKPKKPKPSKEKNPPKMIPKIETRTSTKVVVPIQANGETGDEIGHSHSEPLQQNNSLPKTFSQVTKGKLDALISLLVNSNADLRKGFDECVKEKFSEEAMVMGLLVTASEKMSKLLADPDDC